MLFEHISYLDENFHVVEDGFVAVEGSFITYIGKERPDGEFGDVYHGKDKLLFPGFYNAHSHVPMTLLRGYGEGLNLQDWLYQKVFPFEARLDDERTFAGSMLGIAEMLRCGVVSFSDMYMHCEAIAEAVKQTGIKANICQSITCFDKSAYRDLPDFANTQRLIKNWHGAADGRILVDLCIHGEYTSHEGVVRDAAAYAKENQLSVQVHVSETQSEHEDCKTRHKKTPVEYFAGCGLFDVPAIAAHCVWVEEKDMELLAEKGVTVAHCPSSNMKLGSGIAPVAGMLDKGVRVALGTDGASSNNNLNMLEEIHLAGLLQKGFRRNPSLLPPKQLLQMATFSGAQAQGRGDSGRIREGNRADLAVIDCGAAHMVPAYDLAGSMVYTAQGSDVVLTMADGKVLYRDGEFLTLDIERCKYYAREAASSILREL